MKTLLFGLVLSLSLPAFAQPCGSFLTFESDLKIDPRLSQALVRLGLDESSLLDLLHGPNVLVEDPDHPSEVLRILHVRSPVDGLVYATEAIAEEHLARTHVYSLMGIRRERDREAQMFEARVQEQQRERAIASFAAQYIPAEYDELVDQIDDGRPSGDADELSPANDDDEDRKYLTTPETGVFAGKTIFRDYVIAIKLAPYRVGIDELKRVVGKFTREGRAFDREAAYRLNMRWLHDENQTWIAVPMAGRHFALLMSSPNDHSIVIVDLELVSPNVFNENPAWP
jgi:hypothetical protein